MVARIIRLASPADCETARIGSETTPRATGQRRRHQSETQSATPQIASTTSSGPSSPLRAAVTRLTVPSPIAVMNSALSMTHWRCERGGAGA